ncbi:MAG: bifunctional serine/threonine-protein kinase/formylglycine-generating enzyme family protein [Rhodanobacteraceae bacterium]
MNVRNPRSTGAPGYRLIHWIGASGTAAVYAAAELSSGRLAAIKIFHRVDSRGLARLEQLLQANARLSHPNIVGIHAIGYTGDGRLFHSMPLLLGFERLRHDLLGRPSKIAALLRDLLGGLDHAHRCGMVHGDIKPSNVLFDKHGRAQLADFGIACCMAEPELPRPETTRHLSPEQVRGDPPDVRSDLYSVGMLAYELLTDASPSPAGNASTANVQPMPRLPPAQAAWQAWIDRALAPSPEHRFQSAREMTIVLAAIGGQHDHGQVVRITQRKPPPKRRLAVTVVVVAIATLVALAGWLLRGNRGSSATQVANVPAVATVRTSAPSTANTQPAPAPPAAAGTVSPLAQHVQALVAAADALQAHGHAFSPTFGNAASHYLAALALDPGNPGASAGIDAMLAKLHARLRKTWDHKSAEAVRSLRHGDVLATHADAPARRHWHDYRNWLVHQVGDALAQAARTRDSRKITSLAPLAKALHVKVPVIAVAKAKPKPAPRTPAAGSRLRDPRGPVLVYEPAAGGTPAFAIERVEVTRADYAVFARATHRTAAACREAHNPFSRLHHLTWQAPGFAQAGDDPAVCVSWDDAIAYATWLSKRTGKPYRLPNDGEWLRAARGMPKGTPCQLGNVDDASRRSVFDDDRFSCNDGAAQTAPVGHYAASGVGAYDMYGNVSEWLAGGTSGPRSFRGISWRDGSHETALGSHGTADSDVGYTSVGFRVVRVIDAAHPAPPAVPHD